MKIFSLLMVSMLMTLAGDLSAGEQPYKRKCECTDCKCTPKSHCGCYSDEGCSQTKEGRCRGGGRINTNEGNRTNGCSACAGRGRRH
ncbi:MAG: hypothetical protein Q8K75_07805 [Chlamydiales bacterium]|nr:hypothetical protein [Chlamydiales bacterium]